MKRSSNVLDRVLLTFSSGLMLVAMPVLSAPPPKQVGKCADTFIQQVGTRLSDGATGTPIEGSGTSVSLTNGVYLVSYDEIPSLKNYKVGEKVKLCLLSIPSHCPPGDDRGRFYSLFNYRTRQTVKLPDSQHLCGGA